MKTRTRSNVRTGAAREFAVQARVRRWGSSCGLIIPKGIRQRLGIHEGTEVSVELEGQRIIISKCPDSRRPRRPLSQIVPRLTPREPLDGWDDATPIAEERL